ncbi:hypothetical protein NG798_25205 [Ancylothrix sp. C2]|uniref:hypothetical protein n=1 Tax=Ancylothrix sp. D3o TaxID=2953691 RepID=UPI0021BB32BE|nr:hypothetical protein [Ancylothrix sp. D3o]MCT7953100.1 hypothetical protein [Ancylothrix sp. D3o]
MPVDIGERLLVAVVSVNMDVPVDTRYGLLVALMLGDSTAVVDMNMAVARMLGDSRAAVDMNMAVDMNVAVPVDIAVSVDIVMPTVVDMNVWVVMSVAVVSVAMVPADIDNPVDGRGGGLPSLMLRNLLSHYHYAVTLVFRWRVPVVQRLGVPVLYPHKLSPQ